MVNQLTPNLLFHVRIVEGVQWKLKYVINVVKRNQFLNLVETQGSLQTARKECMAEYNRLHYQRNKEIYSAKAKENVQSIREYIQSIKSQLKCSICGEDRYWCLDFHHTNPHEKEYNISSLVHDGARQKIEEELKKCIIVCSNCHRDIHYKDKSD